MPTLLCLHGNSSSQRVFDPLKEKLNNRINIFAIDFPGHGDKPHTAKQDYSWDNLKSIAIDAAKNIDDDIILYGNSLGGHIALEVAGEIHNCKGLIISGTPPLQKPLELENAFSGHPATSCYFVAEPDEKELLSAIEILSYSQHEKELLLNDFKRCDPQTRVALAENVADGSTIADEVTLLKKLDIPCLILEGDEDILPKAGYMKQISEGCGCELVHIEGGGHFLTIQMPERTAHEIESFANRHGLF